MVISAARFDLLACLQWLSMVGYVLIPPGMLLVHEVK